MHKRDLPRVLTRFSVDIVAVDNVLELAPNWNELAAFMALFELPPRLVEVTRILGKSYPLSSIASSLGIAQGHLTPLKAAEAASKLAYMGIGSEVLLYEEETHIIVRRSRSPTQGGMSRERYRRNVELAVLEESRKIRDRLRQFGLDYDAFVEKGEYGLKGSVFIVYAPPAKVRRIIKPKRGPGYIIKVKPIVRSKVEFVPLGRKRLRHHPPKRYLLVGVDPGVWTGLAILDLTGRLLHVSSHRWLGRGQIIREVSKYGTVAVVATDVNPPPPFVRKLASSLNAHIYYPPRSLTVEEKRGMVSLLKEVKIKDSHQRDALAAALKAFNHYSRKFSQLEKKISELGLPLPIDEAKYLLIRGLSVNEIIRQLAEKYLLGKESIGVREKIKEKSYEGFAAYAKKLEENIVELKASIEELRREKNELLQELSQLEETLSRVLRSQRIEALRFRTIRVLESKIEGLLSEVGDLRRENARLKEENKRLSEALSDILEERALWGYVVSGITGSSVSSLPKRALRKPLLVLEPRFEEGALDELIKREPECVILRCKTEKEKDTIRRYGIPVIEDPDGSRLDLAVLNEKIFVIRNIKRYTDMLAREKEKVNVVAEKAAKSKVLALIKNYREERARALKRREVEYRL